MTTRSVDHVNISYEYWIINDSKKVRIYVFMLMIQYFLVSLWALKYQQHLQPTVPMSGRMASKEKVNWTLTSRSIGYQKRQQQIWCPWFTCIVWLLHENLAPWPHSATLLNFLHRVISYLQSKFYWCVHSAGTSGAAEECIQSVHILNIRLIVYGIMIFPSLLIRRCNNIKEHVRYPLSSLG